MEPIMQFRTSEKSTEFWRWVATFAGLFITQFFIQEFTHWAIAICVICSAYAISRGLHKKSRLAIVGKGERTTEFYVTAIGSLIILIRTFMGDVPIHIGLICIAVIEASYVLSRGQGKSFIPAAKVSLIR